MRRYPWGEAMDRARANLWGSGPGRPVPVDEFPDGVSVGGVHQLIGNVWEWTAGAFHSREPRTRPVQTKMKSIRGGAFDTYFDNQATCQFQSGDVALIAQAQHRLPLRRSAERLHSASGRIGRP